MYKLLHILAHCTLNETQAGENSAEFNHLGVRVIK